MAPILPQRAGALKHRHWQTGRRSEPRFDPHIEFVEALPWTHVPRKPQAVIAQSGDTPLHRLRIPADEGDHGTFILDEPRRGKADPGVSTVMTTVLFCNLAGTLTSPMSLASLTVWLRVQGTNPGVIIRCKRLRA
jgi:hypothetical protein